MKKFLKVVAGVALAGCMLVPLAACSDTSDNSKEVKQLQQQVQDLQTEVDSLKNNNSLTGCPKFEYSLNETIPYYINGTKIFDFKITNFEYNSSATRVKYTISFTSGFNENPTSIFSANLYDESENVVYNVRTHNEGSLTFSMTSGKKATIILKYCNIPFASVTATPTQI